MQAKPVQIAVIVIGLLVGVVGIVLAVTGGNKVDLADRMIFVDVTSGDFYSVSDRGRSLLIPYRNPESQERTLFPAEQDEASGSWKLKSRYLDGLDSIDSIHRSIDPESGAIDTPEKVNPSRID
ncbi:MAG: hypothetical protein Phyf2KO_04530 [Phycisphaerales bacterium]